MSSTEPEREPGLMPDAGSAPDEDTTSETGPAQAAAEQSSYAVENPGEDAADQAEPGQAEQPEPAVPGETLESSEPAVPRAQDELADPQVSVVQDGAADQLEVTEPAELDPGAIEAILLITDEPLQASSLAEVLEQPVPRVEAALNELATEFTEQGRGFDLREVAGGWRLYTREQYAAIVEKFVLDGQQAKLTQAALETLAVVAYRQPASRARVSAIRGVNCDGVMKTLLARGLITETGTDRESGAILFGTTGYFLERLGLGSLDELPDLAPYLPDIDEMEELAAGMGGSRMESTQPENQPAAEQRDGGRPDEGRPDDEEELTTEQPEEPSASDGRPDDPPNQESDDQPHEVQRPHQAELSNESEVPL